MHSRRASCTSALYEAEKQHVLPGYELGQTDCPRLPYAELQMRAAALTAPQTGYILTVYLMHTASQKGRQIDGTRAAL
eukprot:1453471-Pleurochrysis_carterae.AAC.2